MADTELIQIDLASLLSYGPDGSAGDGVVSIYDLPDTAAPKPSPELVRSVMGLGILQPVILERDGETFRVIDGRRRIAAARLAGLLDVPARIITLTGIEGASVVTLTANATRTENPATELHSIVDLQKQGYDVNAIAKATGMKVGTIQKRLRLLGLIPRLLWAFETGGIPVGVAEAAAKLPAATQERLADRRDEGERLTHELIKEERTARAQSTIAALPASLFEVENIEDDAFDASDPEDLFEREVAILARRAVALGIKERDAVRIFRHNLRASQE